MSEFCRFYLDRRTQELLAAGTDARKRKKVEDDFTPRLDTTLVGMDGTVRRQLRLKTLFDLGSEHEYETTIAVIPAESKRKCPELYRCSVSQKIAPLGKPAGAEVEVLAGLQDGERLVAKPGAVDLNGKRIEAE